MEPWYRIATPRKEVRQAAPSADEFAIHLEQVIAGTAPEDYREPEKFFSRTCFHTGTREHAAMVLRRLAGETVNTAPVMTLIAQFGGGKTHTHGTLSPGNQWKESGEYPGVRSAFGSEPQIVPGRMSPSSPGNAWDPQDGRETPWIVWPGNLRK